MTDLLEKDAFHERLGEEFRIEYGAEQSLIATLHEVTGVPADCEKREPFSILFLAPMEPILDQSIYAVRNESLGDLDLFLVPLGPTKDSDGMIYEAVFT